MENDEKTAITEHINIHKGGLDQKIAAGMVEIADSSMSVRDEVGSSDLQMSSNEVVDNDNFHEASNVPHATTRAGESICLASKVENPAGIASQRSGLSRATDSNETSRPGIQFSPSKASSSNVPISLQDLLLPKSPRSNILHVSGASNGVDHITRNNLQINEKGKIPERPAELVAISSATATSGSINNSPKHLTSGKSRREATVTGAAPLSASGGKIQVSMAQEIETVTTMGLLDSTMQFTGSPRSNSAHRQLNKSDDEEDLKPTDVAMTSFSGKCPDEMSAEDHILTFGILHQSQGAAPVPGELHVDGPNIVGNDTNRNRRKNNEAPKAIPTNENQMLPSRNCLADNATSGNMTSVVIGDVIDSDIGKGELKMSEANPNTKIIDGTHGKCAQKEAPCDAMHNDGNARKDVIDIGRSSGIESSKSERMVTNEFAQEANLYSQVGEVALPQSSNTESLVDINQFQMITENETSVISSDRNSSVTDSNQFMNQQGMDESVQFEPVAYIAEQKREQMDLSEDIQVSDAASMALSVSAVVATTQIDGMGSSKALSHNAQLDSESQNFAETLNLLMVKDGREPHRESPYNQVKEPEHHDHPESQMQLLQKELVIQEAILDHNMQDSHATAFADSMATLGHSYVPHLAENSYVEEPQKRFVSSSLDQSLVAEEKVQHFNEDNIPMITPYIEVDLTPEQEQLALTDGKRNGAFVDLDSKDHAIPEKNDAIGTKRKSPEDRSSAKRHCVQSLTTSGLCMSSDIIECIMKAAFFAATRLSGVQRADPEGSPYINHVLQRGYYIWTTANCRNPVLLQAAILGDSVNLGEEGDPEEILNAISIAFGDEVCQLVKELTYSRSLSPDERKQKELERLAGMSSDAKLIYLADKVLNLKQIAQCPPIGWNLSRCQSYFQWVKAIIDSIRGTNEMLEQEALKLLCGNFYCGGKAHPCLVTPNNQNNPITLY